MVASSAVVRSVVGVAAPTSGRWELYRLLAEPMRLRVLALAAEEELGVGELAELLGEAQPNVSKHAAALRQAGLLVVRKEGTRVLVRLAESADGDAVVADALAAGRDLCVKDGSLGRIAAVVRARDAVGRAFFSRGGGDRDPASIPAELGVYLAAIAPLITHRDFAIDAATGDGGMLDVLAPTFARVVAFDREEAQLDRCRVRLAARGYRNVDLVRGAVDSADVRRAVDKHGKRGGGADVVFAARFLHHAPQPVAALTSLASLARPGGTIVVLDYQAHDDEAMRSQADLWLGFDTSKLRRFAKDAGLSDVHVTDLGLAPALREGREGREPRDSPDAHLGWQLLVATRPDAATRNVSAHKKKRNEP